jgi:hypothetical protein
VHQLSGDGPRRRPQQVLFPVGKVKGGEWPLLQDMVAQNQRLVVFTSKQGSDGLAYEWKRSTAATAWPKQGSAGTAGSRGPWTPRASPWCS